MSQRESAFTPAPRREPAWQPYRRVLRFRVPEKIRPWLLDPTSLTRRLQSVSNNRFQVQVIAEAWSRPHTNEARVLGMKLGVYAFVRQVYLLGNGTPWVYARTVIPASTLTGAQRCLGRLNTRPLGAVLFASPHMQRAVVEVVRLTADDKLYRAASHCLNTQPLEIWGRRSVFSLASKPLLVSEIFLPSLPAWPG